jgi:hypothetical protein
MAPLARLLLAWRWRTRYYVAVLLAAASRIATRLARIRAEGTPSLADFRHALRDVARCCLYGVDRNPMAVELTKVALWIETVDPGLPLGFFDAQVCCGDALLGIFNLNVLQAGVPDAAYKPLAGDDKDTAKYYLQASRAAKTGQGGFDFGAGQATMPAIKPLALDFSGFRNLPEDTVEQIGAKTARFDTLRKGQTFVRAQVAADLYVAAFLLPKTGGAPSGASSRTLPTTEELWRALQQGKIGEAMMEARKAASRARAFHWPLEFPDVMATGGFDVVVGNPPWERIKLQEQEFFAAREPEIAQASNAAARGLLIAKLKEAAPGTRERTLYEDFEAAKRTAEASSVFARVSGDDGGRFPLTGRGDINTYALFAELFASLRSKRGRVGVIVPTGIATDATTAPFFGALISDRRLVQLIDFENREGLFPAVDSRMKFCLLTIGHEAGEAGFAFFLTGARQLAESERRFTLSADDIARINPNTKTAPVFRSRADAELNAKIYTRVPVLIDETKGKDGNTWGVTISTRLWHMAEDSAWFLTQPTDDSLPLYEAKMIHQFDHRFSSFESDLSPELKINPGYEPRPRYWVPRAEVESRLIDAQNWKCGWLFGWRDITNATNERTVIVAFIPRTAVGHTYPLLFTKTDPRQTAALLANLNAMILDFVARQKVGGTHLTFGYLEQFPVLPAADYVQVDLAFIVRRVLELTYTSRSMAPFARDLGYDGPPFRWDEERRAHLRAELDAWYARAYGLTRDELRYILDPADVKGPDYPSETFRVLKKNERARFGEYRTARLVLQAWDQMERGDLG